MNSHSAHPKKRTAEEEDKEQSEYTHATDQSNKKQKVSQSTSSSQTLSIAQRCYKDALHCIYRFLTLKELLPAAHSCQYWYAAAKNEQSRALHFDCLDGRISLSLFYSPLNHHVGSLKWYGMPSLTSLSTIRALMGLRELDCNFAFSPAQIDEEIQKYGLPAAHPMLVEQMHFPAQLTHLTLEMFPCTEEEPLEGSHLISFAQCLIHMLPYSPQLTSLHLTANFADELGDAAPFLADFNVQPILQLQQLTELTIYGDNVNSLWAPVVAQMSGLKTLNFISLHRHFRFLDREQYIIDMLRTLASMPNPMQLEELNVCGDLRSDYLSALAGTFGQSLTSLDLKPPYAEAQSSDPQPLDDEWHRSLARFVSLQRLILASRYSSYQPTPVFAQSLSHCSTSSLTDVTFERFAFSHSAAQATFSAHSALRCLTFESCRFEPSDDLTFLNSCTQLEYLQLFSCWLTADEPHHWNALKLPHLKELRWSSYRSLPDSIRSILQPPSSLFPSLHSLTIVCIFEGISYA